MKSIVFALSFAVLLLSHEVIALDKNGKFAIKGVGNISCREFVAHSKNDKSEKLLFAGWINGYLTAQNQHLKDNFDVTSWESIETLGNYLVGYCSKHEEVSFFQAVTLMVNTLHEERITEFKGASFIEKGVRGEQLYSQVVERVQRVLAEQGFYQGSVDGKINDPLKAAIINYKKKQGLTPTAELDQRILFKLLRQK